MTNNSGIAYKGAFRNRLAAIVKPALQPFGYRLIAQLRRDVPLFALLVHAVDFVELGQNTAASLLDLSVGLIDFQTGALLITDTAVILVILDAEIPVSVYAHCADDDICFHDRNLL